MNIAMEQTEEYVNSQLKNKYGDAFIRGNNGMYMLFSAISHCQLIIPYYLFVFTTYSDCVVLYISAQKRRA
jgi:hypothetical protein